MRLPLTVPVKIALQRTSTSALSGEARSTSRLYLTIVRGVLLFAMIGVLAACNEGSPTAPENVPPRGDASAELFGTVFVQGSNGKCLTGATIEVVGGPAAGKSAQQSEVQCVNQGNGLGPAYRLTGLPYPDVKVRASAPGYWTQERVAYTQPRGTELSFELFKSPDLSLGFVYGTVWGSHGCLTGAKIEVLDGSAAGKVFLQSAMDCSNNDGSGNSYFLTDLPMGSPIKIRASMQGYEAQERFIDPRPDTFAASNDAVDFRLTAAP